jgi:hypothetical protein
MAEPYRASTPLATGTVTAKRRFRYCKNPAVSARWYERIASAPDGISLTLNHL